MRSILSLLKGRTLAGRYRIEHLLGRGGMGAVFAAEDLHLERTVAVKLIDIDFPDVDTEATLRARFRQEALAAAGLGHPNLVPVFDLGVDAETKLDFIVMELLAGEDLDTRLRRRKPNSLDFVLEVLLQAADALGVAHANRLIHRDIKPSNLFLEPLRTVGAVSRGLQVPRVRVLDFGIARMHRDDGVKLTRTTRGHAPMTMAYAAPEQLRGDADVGAACDVFALGVTAYEMLTGKLPFSDAERAKMVRGGAVPHVVLRDRVPGPIADVITKALAPAPADRYPDATAFAEALREGRRMAEAARGRDPERLFLTHVFSSVPLTATTPEVADACVDAVRSVLGGTCSITIPSRPVPITAGGPRNGMELLCRFPALGGEGEVWTSADEVPGPVRDALAEHLARVWQVQALRFAQALEVDQLRFHLSALQQVARTLAVVRGEEETERVVLDSVGEVFFSWWAALYVADGEQYVCRAVRSLRGESVAFTIPAHVVQKVVAVGQPPALPGPESDIHAYVPAEVSVVAPLDFGDGYGGLLILGKRMTEAPYEEHELRLLRALADSCAIALRNAELLDRLRGQATVDPLTGCLNRRGFEEVVSAEVRRASRDGTPLSFILASVENLSRTNRDFGYETGDELLKRVGRAMRHTFRADDVACRCGGGEFVLVMPQTTLDEADNFAERLRVLFETLPPNAEVPMQISARVRTAAYPDAASIPEIWNAVQ